MGSLLHKHNANTFFLFDLDGTLTECGQPIERNVYNFITKEVKAAGKVGIVSGSCLKEMLSQLGENAMDDIDYMLSENGLVAYKGNEVLGRESIIDFLGETKLQEIVNFALGYMSKLKLPKKRGTFFDFRTGLINISPVGRSCTLEERIEFNEFDKIHNIRKNFVSEMQKKFPDYGLKFSIGGKLAFDVFPLGWDKSYCLKYLENFSTIYYFGDKTLPGENDFEIFQDKRTIAHHVNGPEDTVGILHQILKS